MYETLESTLQRYPNTLLGSPRNRRALLDSRSNVLTVKCNTCTFDAILFYYQSNGILTCPPSLSTEYFEAQCRYFAIDECDIRRMKQRDQLFSDADYDDEILVYSCDFHRKIWEFLDQPRTSLHAAIYAIINYILITFSILIACMQTSSKLNFNDDQSLFFTDLALNMLFGIEYVVRFTFSPNKIDFCRTTLNIIDFLAIWPHFIFEMLTLNDVSSPGWLQALPSLRILRLIRLGKQSRRLEFVFRILSNCLIDVFTMILAVFVSSVFYASIVYYAEQTCSETTQFTSIPQSLWWAIQTLIPLGYGDIVPITVLGKISAGMVCVLAAFSFTVPVLFLGGKFLGLYSKSFGVVLGDDFQTFDLNKE